MDAVEFQQLSDVAGCLAQAMSGQKGYVIQHGRHGIQLDKLAMEPRICGHTLFDFVRLCLTYLKVASTSSASMGQM